MYYICKYIQEKKKRGAASLTQEWLIEIVFLYLSLLPNEVLPVPEGVLRSGKQVRRGRGYFVREGRKRGEELKIHLLLKTFSPPAYEVGSPIYSFLLLQYKKEKTYKFIYINLREMGEEDEAVLSFRLIPRPNSSFSFRKSRRRSEAALRLGGWYAGGVERGKPLSSVLSILLIKLSLALILLFLALLFFHHT